MKRLPLLTGVIMYLLQLDAQQKFNGIDMNLNNLYRLPMRRAVLISENFAPVKRQRRNGYNGEPVPMHQEILARVGK